MIFKVLKVGSVNLPRDLWDQRGSPRDPRGDQKGDKKGSKAEKVIFRKWLFYVGGSIKTEAGGDQKAPQGPPGTKSKIEEKTKTKKKGNMITKSGHGDHWPDLRGGQGALGEDKIIDID